MIATLTALMTSSGFGVLTGLVGSWLAKREARKVLELQNLHAERMAEARRAEMQLESELQVQVLEAEGAIAADVAAGQAFTESQKQGQDNTGIHWVDALRGAMRPIITLYLLAVISLLAFRLTTITGGLEALPASDAFNLYRDIVNQAVFLTVTAVTWWFGSRPGRAAS